MSTIYLVRDWGEAEYLSSELGVNVRDCIPVSLGWQGVEGRVMDGVQSTYLARRHPLFEAVLEAALANLARGRTPRTPLVDFGLRLHGDQ